MLGLSINGLWRFVYFYFILNGMNYFYLRQLACQIRAGDLLVLRHHDNGRLDSGQHVVRVPLIYCTQFLTIVWW